MKTVATLTVVLFAVGTGLALGPVARAQDTPTPPPAGDHGMMSGDMKAMMGMMGQINQMNQMMENCNRMMQSKNDGRDEKKPAQKGRPG